MMEHISLIRHKKNGVSMVELIAYVALYGVVMSLLASLVFVIVQAARKVNSQAILNRGATIMYTEILSQTISLNPDTVSDVTYTTGADGKPTSVSVTFSKVYGYAESDNETHSDGKGGTKKYNAGERYPLDTPSTVTYTFYKKDSAPTGKKDDTIYVNRNGSESTISLEYGMTISSASNDDDITNCIQVATQNSSNKYVTFNGFLHFDKKTLEFNFIIPVFVASLPDETNP